MTLSRGLALLEAFGPADTALGHAELVRRTGLPRSTVSRLSAALVDQGWMQRGARGKFLPGALMLSLAQAVQRRLPVRDLARPHLQDMAEQIQGAVALVAASGVDAVFIETTAARGDRSSHPEVGDQWPIARLAVGRALLSQLAGSGDRPTPPDVGGGGQTVAHSGPPDALAALGYWRSQDGDGLATPMIGVPLLTTPDGLVLALSCSLVGGRAEARRLEDAIAPRALALAEKVRKTWSGYLLHPMHR